MEGGDFNFIEISKEFMPEAKDLPGELSEIAEIIGVPNTLKLAQRFRGSAVYIRNIDYLIWKQRNDNIRKSYDVGGKVSQLAREHRLSIRQIWRILGSAE
jgi:Mor family transcriptional regulator